MYHDHTQLTPHQVSLSESWWLQAEIAGRISVKQFNIALSLGDPVIVARCKLYLALSLVQRGHLVSARRIIEQQYYLACSALVLDTQLISICLGIWAKLKYEHHRRRTERRGKKWQGCYKQTLSLPSKFVLWMSFSFTPDTRKSVWNSQGFVLTAERCFATKQKLIICQGWQTFFLHGANSRSSTTWWTERDIYCCTRITQFFRSWHLCGFEYNTNYIYGLRWLLKFVLCILWLKIINVIIQMFLDLCYIHSKIKLQSVKLYKSNFIFPSRPLLLTHKPQIYNPLAETRESS